MYTGSAQGIYLIEELGEIFYQDSVPKNEHKNQRWEQPRPGQITILPGIHTGQVWAKPGWASSEHPLADVQTRTECKTGQAGPLHQPVHIRVWTGGCLG